MVNEILNYTIIRKIGEGSMGRVFLAKNKSIHQFVAIKMLNPKFSSNPELRERFRQEAVMLSALDHPGIVKFLNYVENEQGIFLIMEFVDGMTLEDYLNTKTGLIVEQKALPMMEQILDAFAYAHARNIVHRDIKPGNIFVTKEGNIKILDFGIAQILSEADATPEGHYAGTTEYMSPEQIRGKALDIRSDIYSLGVVFHQMLTGRPPYNTNEMSDLDLKEAIVKKPLGRMKAVYPYISDNVQRLVDRATCKDPQGRFADCNEMKQETRRISLALEHGQTGSSGGNNKRGSSFAVWIWSTVGAVVLVGLGVLGFIIYSRNMDRLYGDYVDAWGVARGIDTGDDVRDGPIFKISYSGGKPSRLLYIDAAGNTMTVSDSVLAHYKPSETEYQYREDGSLELKKAYSKSGKLLYTVSYDPALSKAKRETPGDSAATFYRLIHDPATGRLDAIHYVDDQGQKTTSQGVYGEAYTYDGRGRLMRITYLDADYKPAENFKGVGIVGFEYTGNGVDGKASFFDRNGKPVDPNAPKAPETGVKKKKKYKREPVYSPTYDGYDGYEKKPTNKKDERVNLDKRVMDPNLDSK